VTGEAAKAARLYGQAQKAVIVADEDTVTPDAIKLLAGMAVITGKIGNARRGIIIARSKSNSQGFIDMGIKMPGSEMIDMIEAGKVKAMVLLGEDPASLDGRVKKALDKLELLIVGDMFITESAKGANMVFPISSTAETFGTFTRTDRMIQEVVPAIEPITGATNLDILLGVADRLGLGFMDIMEIRENISSEIRGYRGVSTAFFDKGGVYWPGLEDGNGRHGLYPDGFVTENKKAHLMIPKGTAAFSDRVLYDTIDRQFEDYMKANGIKA
jgi:formate dehydrogenase major subunit